MTGLELASKIEYYLNRRGKYSVEIELLLISFLEKEQFKKFINHINMQKRSETLPSALVKNFTILDPEKPEQEIKTLRDSEIAENWSFAQIMKSVQFAID